MVNTTENNIYEIPVKVRSHVVPTRDGGHLNLMINQHFFVEAKDEREAVHKLRINPNFYKNYNRLSLDKRKELRPFKFLKGKIEKVLECELRHKNLLEEYICGEPSGNEDYSLGIFGMCCIGGYSVPETEKCPYSSSAKKL